MALNIIYLLVSLLALICAGGSWALENGVARTPPMGWMAWQRFACETNCEKYPKDCINEQLFKEMADRMALDGWRRAGYEYINIDDCWSDDKREPHSNRLLANETRFPSGLRHLADLIHGLDLKFGIYGDCGTATCAGYPAQLRTESLEGNYFDEDAKSFASWDIDSLKFDGCNLDPPKADSICPKMTQALAQNSKRPILLTCEWIFYQLRMNVNIDLKLSEESCNLMRYYEDIEDSWQSILNTIDFTVARQDEFSKFHGPGHWMDPDQLVIGDFGLTLNQAEAQMAIWSIWSAPLFMGNDLRHISPKNRELLQNHMLIEVDQDHMGIMGKMIYSQKDHNNITRLQVFVKPVAPVWNGCPSFAVAYLSRHILGGKQIFSLPLKDILSKADIELAGERDKMLYPANSTLKVEECRQRILMEGVEYHVTDLVAKKERPVVSTDANLELAVVPSGVAMVKLTERFA